MHDSYHVQSTFAEPTAHYRQMKHITALPLDCSTLEHGKEKSENFV